MPDFALYMDNSQIKAYTEKLKKMHRSDLPLTIRATLNDMAFDVKQSTLLQSADKEFILRNPTFFKKHSGVKKATGFNINSMKSEVGIIPAGLKSAENLTKQEYGGTIQDRSTIFMNQARISKDKSKKVRKVNYLGTKGLVGGKPLKGYGKRSRKSNFVAAAFVAKRENKNLLWETKRGYTLFSINNIKFSGNGSDRNAKINAIPIANYEKNRNVKIISRPFLRNASKLTYRKQEHLFIMNARKRMEKSLK